MPSTKKTTLPIFAWRNAFMMRRDDACDRSSMTLAEDTLAKTFTHSDTHGDFSYKVVGRNLRGLGPESEVATVSG